MLPFKCYAKDSVKVPLFCIKEQMCLSLCLKQLRNLWCQRNLWSQTKRSELFVRPSVQLLYWVRFSKVLHAASKSKPFLQVLCSSLTLGSRSLPFSEDLTYSDFKKVSGKVHDTAVGPEIPIRDAE